MKISVRDNELFKGVIKEAEFDCNMDKRKVTVRSSHYDMIATIKARLDVYDGGFDYIRLVKLYAQGFKESEYTLKKVWTDAYNEASLLNLYPRIFSECDRSILTYDWDEFSSFIDTLKADYDKDVEKRHEDVGDVLPF